MQKVHLRSRDHYLTNGLCNCKGHLLLALANPMQINKAYPKDCSVIAIFPDNKSIARSLLWATASWAGRHGQVQKKGKDRIKCILSTVLCKLDKAKQSTTSGASSS